MALMSGRAYAKRRGVSAMAVSKAIKSKVLDKSIALDEYGIPKIADPELADREWDANTDLTKAPVAVLERSAAAGDDWWEEPDAQEPPQAEPAAAVGMSVAEASAVEKYWRAKLVEQKFKLEAGELVPASDVERRLSEVFHSCKVRLLGLPARARQALPQLSVLDVTVLEGLVREALEELSGSDGSVA